MSHHECGADASQHSMESAPTTTPARTNTRSPPRMSRRLKQSRSRSYSRSPEEVNPPFRTRQLASRTALQVGPPLPALNTLQSYRIHDDENERPEAYSPPLLSPVHSNLDNAASVSKSGGQYTSQTATTNPHPNKTASPFPTSNSNPTILSQATQPHTHSTTHPLGPHPTPLPSNHNLDLCTAPDCLLKHPHAKGRYLARGQVPRTWNEYWGYSDPPREVWRSWTKMVKVGPDEWDEALVKGFGECHFWDGD